VIEVRKDDLFRQWFYNRSIWIVRLGTRIEKKGLEGDVELDKGAIDVGREVRVGEEPREVIAVAAVLKRNKGGNHIKMHVKIQ